MFYTNNLSKNLEYLKFGNERQKIAFIEIKRNKIFEILEK